MSIDPARASREPPSDHPTLYDPRFEHDACGIGFVADIKGRASHQTVLDAARVLRNMSHRGACGCEVNTGDGAGILTGLPHDFLRLVARSALGLELPEPGRYAAGNVFLPTDPDERQHCKDTFARLAREGGLSVLGWRRVPTDADGADIGPSARASLPAIEQLFLEAPPECAPEAFERHLYLLRKRAGTALRNDARLRQAKQVYVCSLSSKVLVYKGMLTPEQLLPFYPDLAEWQYKTHLAMVHSRFSTNTFPSWDRAQPLRMISHNGEINTLAGNLNAMRSRERVAESPHFGAALPGLFPVAEPDCSDSGNFDNVLEFLVMGGRSIAEAMMMMIPEAWQNDPRMPAEKRAFYEYNACLMEPWDGPAAMVFTDGDAIGAVLDRNGLRPSRYYVTHDDRVILASEVGVLDLEIDNIREKGRLMPGRIFLVDFRERRLVPDEEVKARAAKALPYGAWLARHRRFLTDLKRPARAPLGLEPLTLMPRLRAFGYTTETLDFQLVPLATQGTDPLGSMGNDAALAVLSDEPRLPYDYFKQLFAQVTNPPIDPIREAIVMSLECPIGPEQSLLGATPEHAARLVVKHPVLSNTELATLVEVDEGGFKSATIDITWPRSRGAAGIDASLRQIALEAERAVDEGRSFVILSDRATSADRVPISALLAVGAVHAHLVRTGKRTRVGLVLESGEPREVHHFCLLSGYGADAINPYLAFEALWQARRDGRLDAASDDAATETYRKALGKGILKVMAKMGISTLQSYKGAQIFEAVGLGAKVIQRCFPGTPSRLGGVGFDVLADEAVRRHERGFPTARPLPLHGLVNDGQVHWRAGGERHMWDPEAIASLQAAARQGDPDAYRRFAEHADADARTRCTLRGILRFRATTEIPLTEVEPAAEIVRRFVTGAMSFGSISEEAHTTLALAMNSLGGKSNTGEGGEDPARYLRMPDGSPNPRRSRIKQVASGRFGVTIEYLTHADEIQVKMAQGAKPGEGGELPGRKVDDHIARVRHSTPGVGLISPPPHHDIYSIEDLAELIYDLKSANPSARISVKLVSEVGVGTIAAGVAKAHAEHILVSGHDGGTGASPLTSSKHAGLPWELGLAEAQQTLVMNDLRSRVVLQVDGQLKTGRDVVIAALLGAEEFGFSTAPLIALGCIMMRKCHLNTCPVGVATQDPVLRRRFQGLPEHVVNYLFMVAEHARELMAKLGFRTIREMVGRTEVLEVDEERLSPKAQTLDLLPLLTPARRPYPSAGVVCSLGQDHGLEDALDNRLIEIAREAIDEGLHVEASLPIRNVNRAVGTRLSHEVALAGRALTENAIRFRFRGTAGQSFGAWLARGITLTLEGDANDSVGKGLSGGTIVVYPPHGSTFEPSENVIVGNVALYGAVSGKAFFRGRAAERFAVRNSGAEAVVEGVGDHGCEYMTGGRVVVLGPVGRNFAAGMSGGIACVWDPKGQLATRCNTETVVLERIEEEDEKAILWHLVELHFTYTGSKTARRLLKSWELSSKQFVRVMPLDYKRALEATKGPSTPEAPAPRAAVGS